MLLLRKVHKFYKLFLSPLFGTCCRFYPSCSEYCCHAIECHGFAKGTWLAFKRILKCNPFFEGGIDTVPEK